MPNPLSPHLARLLHQASDHSHVASSSLFRACAELEHSAGNGPKALELLRQAEAQLERELDLVRAARNDLEMLVEPVIS